MDPTQSSRVFGVPLGQLMYTSYTEFQIPAFLLRMIKYLEDNGSCGHNYSEFTAINEQGLFRTSGGTAEMNMLKEQINNSEEVDYNKYSIAAIAGVLKLFFRELPEPLFTSELCRDFSQSLGESIPEEYLLSKRYSE